jgi:hypothetical protein
MPRKYGGFGAIEGVDMVYSQFCSKKLCGSRENLRCSSADFGHVAGERTLTSILALIATSKRHSVFAASSWTAVEAEAVIGAVEAVCIISGS